MKKSIIAFAAVAIFSVSNAFAQKVYRSNGHDGSIYKDAPVYQNAKTYYNDDDMSIDQLDNIVKLSRNQENEIAKIKDYYKNVKRSTRKSQTAESIKRLEAQEKHDVMEILTYSQRQKLIAYNKGLKNNHSESWENSWKGNRRG